MTEAVLHLAELNVGRLLAPTDDPRVAGAGWINLHLGVTKA